MVLDPQQRDARAAVAHEVADLQAEAEGGDMGRYGEVQGDTRWFHTCPPKERERESKGDRDPMQFQRNAEHPKKGRRDSRSDNN